MLFPNSFDQTIVQQTAVNWMDKGLFRWHMGEHTILKEITLSYIPYWIVPGSAMTNYVVQETAENVAGTLGTVAASALLSEAVTRGRGGPIIMMGTGQNITKSFQLRGDYQYPVVAVKGWAEFQPKYYEFDLKNRVPFDRKKIPHNFKIFNSDLSENAGMMTAKTSIEQLQAEKAHKQHRFGITSLKTDVTLAEPELLHAPIWYLKYLYKNKDQIIITIDANAMRVMQEIK